MGMQDEFRMIEIESVTIPQYRQRKDLGNLEELKSSIERSGLINPIVIDEDLELVAGERRLTACTELGWEKIPARFFESLSGYDRHVVELEENIRRKDLTWQEQAHAVADYHELLRKHREEKEQDKPAWTTRETANALGMDHSYVSQVRKVAQALRAGDNQVGASVGLKAAINVVQRRQARAGQSEEALADELLAGVALKGDDEEDLVPYDPTEEPPSENGLDESKAQYRAAKRDITKGDFLEWSAKPRKTKFNFIHCDFPYGINLQDSAQTNAARIREYDDDPDLYWALLRALLDNSDNFCHTQCHILFWLSSKLETIWKTKLLFEEAGWTVWKDLLIWHKTDNRGVLPDYRRGPRHVYETALMATRGDRMVAKPVADAYGAPSTTDAAHISQKPEPMLRHFFSLFVDETSVMADFTCGSGTSLVAAEKLGAKRVFGMDILSENVMEAQTLLENHRRMEAMHNLMEAS